MFFSQEALHAFAAQDIFVQDISSEFSWLDLGE